MFDVITFGSATQDIFLELPEGKSLCQSSGAKILIDEVQYFTGGGATNVACGLANLGFKTAYCGKVGNDLSGEFALADLKRFKVNTSLCLKDKAMPTAVSYVLSSGKDRTILIYKGACHFLLESELNLKKIQKAKWFYLAPFYEKTAELFFGFIDFAKKNDIKIAVNPSIEQIEKSEQSFQEALSKVDILFLNKEEAGILAKKPESSIEEIAKTIRNFCSGTIVITQGEKGCLVFDGEYFYKAGIYKVVEVDKTGAGDSFASGFMGGLLKENNIEYAIQLAMLNSAKNISQKGAKIGLLGSSELKILPKIDITKERAY
ncbi:MAG: carbohydrate kinase family protein [bacterium]